MVESSIRVYKHWALIIVLVLLLAYALRGYLARCSTVALEHYVIGSGRPRVVILAGTHGNEPAGTHELRALVSDLRDADRAGKLRGTVVVIPAINAPGLAAGIRTWHGQDLNRMYGRVRPDHPVADSVIAQEVLDVCRGADFVMDFHEGWDYHVRTPESIGSTITGTPDAAGLAGRMVSALNSGIADADKKFQYVEGMFCDIESTLACACHKLGIPYLLCETTGQRDVQPMAIRRAQVRLVCNVLLESLIIA